MTCPMGKWIGRGKLTCPKCREEGKSSDVKIIKVTPVSRSVEEKVTFSCTVCTWTTEAML